MAGHNPQNQLWIKTIAVVFAVVSKPEDGKNLSSTLFYGTPLLLWTTHYDISEFLHVLQLC